MSNPKPSHKSEAVKGHQMLGGHGSDPQIVREAVVYVSHMKGYQRQLFEINQHSGKIECPGCQMPTYTMLLKHLILM